MKKKNSNIHRLLKNNNIKLKSQPFSHGIKKEKKKRKKDKTF